MTPLPVPLWAAAPLLVVLVAALWLLLRQRRRTLSTAQLVLAAFRASPDAITVSRMRDGMLLETNAGFERITGFTREEAVGKTTHELDFWPNADRERIIAALRDSGRADNLDFTLRRKGGELRHCTLSCETLELNGEPCLVAVTRDLTAQREVARKLEASEEKFAKAFRSSPDAITISRLSDGTFLDVNQGFERLSGYAYKDAVGRRAPELGIWHGDDRDAVIEALRRDGYVQNHQITYRLRSGEVRDFLLSAEVIALDGELCMVAISRDVSEMKAAERDREGLIQQLEAQNAELERYAYTVSHDLKSPLVTIMGFLGLVERHSVAGDAAALQLAIERIRSAAGTMNRQLEELLELSRVGRAINPIESVDLAELAREAAELVESRVIAKRARVEIPDELPVVQADRTRLLEVLQNLIENAVKFHDGRSAPHVEIGGEVLGEEVVCFVRDNGIGLEPQFHKRVFELFERLDRKIDGTGVGLALVKRIIEVHGGRIWIESEGTGMGTTVWFTLPIEGPEDGVLGAEEANG